MFSSDTLPLTPLSTNKESDEKFFKNYITAAYSKKLTHIFNITQKYTRSTGGAQDNQYADVVDFLSKGSKKYKVAAIVDGSYWDNSKRQELKNFFNNNNNVQILSMNDILTGGVSFE